MPPQGQGTGRPDPPIERTSRLGQSGLTRRGGLTPREIEVYELIARGLTNSAIARSLSVSVHTVKFHLGSIYRKLGVANRTEAAMALFLHALVDTGQAAPAHANIGSTPVEATTFDGGKLELSTGDGE